MRTGKRNIKRGGQYDYLFPIPQGENKTIKKNANLDDTIHLMKEVVANTLEDTLPLSEMLKASTQMQTCSNIWNFCFTHLQYTKDETGKEQVRRPSRVWQDREKGVDCDCMSVFIGSILTNLGIPYSFRLTKYESLEFEHVYPIAHTTNGVLILDTVVHKFNREVPYSAKKDIKMELQYLNGFEDENEDFDQFDELDEVLENDYPHDAQGLVIEDDLEGIEGRAERKAKRAAKKAKRQAGGKPTLKERLKKGLHVINRLNPGAALLRTGILLSLKLNVMKIASKLRFAYWSDQDAAKNNMDLEKFHQLKRIREKIEKIFYGAGGKPENMKKAILTGKGNRDKRVILNGLGEIISAVYDEDDVKTILGDEIYYDELSEVENGINGLGVVTATAVTAASGVIGTIAALIKKLGSLFKKGSPQAEQEVVQENTENEEEKTRKFSFNNLVSTIKAKEMKIPNAPNASDIVIDDYSDPSFAKTMIAPSGDVAKIDPSKIDPANSDPTNEDDPNEKKGVIGWVKEHPWATAGIATAVVAGTVLTVVAVKRKKKKKALAGIAKRAKKRASNPSSNTKSVAKRKTTTRTRSTNRKRKPSVRRKRGVKKVELL